MKSFRDIALKNETELSMYIWGLQEKSKPHRVYWRKICNASPYSIEAKRCTLCSREKVEIMKILRDIPRRALNKRQQITGVCVHRNKFLLGNMGGIQSERKAKGKASATDSKQSRSVSSSQPVCRRPPNKERRTKCHSQPLDTRQRVSAQEQNRSKPEDMQWGSTRSGHVWRDISHKDAKEIIQDDGG